MNLHIALRRKTGFTLVELLVVIGIIALLVSILLPALNKARMSATQLACKSNMRQLGLAFATYISDNKRYPNFRWPEALNPYVKGTYLGSVDLPDDGLNTSLDKVRPLKLLHCPAVLDVVRSDRKCTLTYSMSGMNFWAGGAFWAMLCIGGQLDETYLPQVNPSKIYRTSEFAVLTEQWNTSNPEQTAWSSTYWRLYVANDFTCQYTHAGGKQSNILFADFHVAPIYSKPNGMDPRSGFPKLTDGGNDSLFNYDYGIKRWGVRRGSKYLFD